MLTIEDQVRVRMAVESMNVNDEDRLATVEKRLWESGEDWYQEGVAEGVEDDDRLAMLEQRLWESDEDWYQEGVAESVEDEVAITMGIESEEGVGEEEENVERGGEKEHQKTTARL